MIHESHAAFNAVKMYAEETPMVPIIIRYVRFFVGDDGLFVVVDPEPVAARRACDDLLWLSYVIVVQRLTIGIQYRFIDHLRFDDMAFEPCAAARTFQIKSIVVDHDVDF
jgi:hypothetical protein